MNNQNPLKIPEILSLVAYFIPAWEGPPHYCKFIPRDLLCCTLVNKAWREAMLPHLWAVYSTYHMEKIPIAVLSRYSVYFRHFDQVHQSRHYISTSYMPPPQWHDPVSEQPLFRSTMLKSFVLSLTSSPEQLELLCTNPGIVSLQWLDFKSNEVTEPLLNMLLPLATSLKELTLSYHGSSSARVPFALLNILTRLERLRIGASSSVPSGQGPSSPPSLIAFQASAPAGSVQHMSLKQLTVMSNISNPATSSLMVQILSHSPKISHLDIMLSECLESHPMDGIHAQVVGWNAAYRDWIQSLDAPPYALPLDSTVSALEDMPNDAHRGLERLEILQRTSSYNFHTWIRPQYERGCQDLVGVSAKFHCDGPRLLVPLLEQWKHMVQQVDIDFGPYLGSHAAFSILSQVLGSLTALKHLRFVAEGGFAKEDSFAIFRDKLGRQDDQGDDDESETAVTTIENVSPAWACQGLESLVIKGLWGTMSKDRLDKGQSAITLQAASERHHWVAYGATKFGKQFRAIVSDRIGTLPALRRLTLNKMAFDYFERCE